MHACPHLRNWSNSLTAPAGCAGALYVAKRSAILRTLYFELGGTSRDIQEFTSATLCSSYLQQLTIQIAPQWQPLITLESSEAEQPDAQIFRKLPQLLQEQLMATKLCLEALSRQAPNLRVLSAINGGALHKVLPTFSKLAHLVLDLWLPRISIDWVQELPCLVTLRLNRHVEHWWISGEGKWLLDLRPMSGLEHMSVTEYLPDRLWLPASCKLHVGDTVGRFVIPMLDPVHHWETPFVPWVTRMEISRTEIIARGGDLPGLLSLDLHLDELILRFEEIGNDAQPLSISARSCKILTQAKQVTMYAKDINIVIPSDVELAWVKVGMFAERWLVLSFDKPEVLLNGRALVMLQFRHSNLGKMYGMWQPIAQRLGLSITKRGWKAKGMVMHELCLSTGSAEDQRVLQAPCICHACLACLEYYGMLEEDT